MKLNILSKKKRKNQVLPKNIYIYIKYRYKNIINLYLKLNY